MLLCLVGFLGAYSVVVVTHGMTLFASAGAVRSVTTLNTALMGGAAVAQWGGGRIVGAFPVGPRDSAVDGYTALFGALAARTIGSPLVYRFADDVRPGRVPGHGAGKDNGTSDAG